MFGRVLCRHRSRVDQWQLSALETLLQKLEPVRRKAALQAESSHRKMYEEVVKRDLV